MFSVYGHSPRSLMLIVLFQKNLVYQLEEGELIIHILQAYLSSPLVYLPNKLIGRNPFIDFQLNQTQIINGNRSLQDKPQNFSQPSLK